MISSLVPYFPRSLTYQFAKRYVAGTTKETALEAIKKLNESGYLVTLDILGEHTKNKDIAADITAQYIDLYREIDARSLQCNISLKPTHIGSEVSADTYNENLQKIINISENTN